jgi:hypothetical protein
MYRLYLIFLLVCLPKPTAAQIFGPVAVPVKERNGRGKGSTWLALDVSAGGNLITRRKLLDDLTHNGRAPARHRRTGGH